MGQQSLFDSPAEQPQQPLAVGPFAERYTPGGPASQEPPVLHLLSLLRQCGLIVVEGDWLTEQWALDDRQVMQALTR